MAGWELSPEAVHAIHEARNLLDDEHKRLTDRFDARSERWKEGDEAGGIEAWMEDLENLLDMLDEIDMKPPES